MAYFLDLVSKLENSQDLGNYITIFLVSSLNKILSKLLALRLTRVLSSAILSCQINLITCKQIMDGVLVENEIIDLARRNKRDCLLFNVNFEKAYDNVS